MGKIGEDYRKILLESFFRIFLILTFVSLNLPALSNLFTFEKVNLNVSNNHRSKYRLTLFKLNRINLPEISSNELSPRV